MSTNMNAIPSIPIADVFSFLWKLTRPDYMCYEENFEALKTRIDELDDMNKDVKERLERAAALSMQNQVQGWSSRVDKLTAEVRDLIDRATQETASNCLWGYCPKNCWSRYKIGKKIDWKIKEVGDQERFREKFHLAANPSDTVWESFQEEKSILGLFGPGGVGKTALLNELSNKLLTSNVHFDFKIWVVGSKDPNLERIQGDIAKEVGFLEDRWEGKTFEDKATEILGALIQKKFALLLDDIWHAVDLQKMGVPSPQNGSKLVFTTRFEDVCDQMGAEEKIRVGGLPWDKAWTLFKEKLGEGVFRIHPLIPTMAEQIAKMCKGFPLVLITIARAMACKRTLEEWDHAIKDLSELSKSGIPGISDQVALLKFSYDNLPSEKARSCFLHFSLFPEDSVVNKSYLIDYWVGEGFLSESRNEGYKIFSTLLYACLLDDEGKDVKMHDLIRDMALWIACESRKENKYLVQAGNQLEVAPEIGEWETVRRVSLIGNHIQNLTTPPRCNDLLTLLLGKNNLKEISGDFFQSMTSLKVLDLSENRELIEFPSGISELNSLEYLNISRTGIRELPSDLKNLVKLKCLNLEHTQSLRIIPVQVISSFSNLHVLRMIHCASSDRVVGDGVQTGGLGSLVSALQCLKHLNLLTITIRSESSLGTFASFNRFQACTRALSLEGFWQSFSLDILFLEDMKCLNEFELIDCTNLKELKIDYWAMWGKCFDSLIKVSIVNCSKLEDLEWLALVPNIELLHVAKCPKLTEIGCQGRLAEGHHNTLGKLEVLRLVSLPNLKSIYPKALPFPCLKEVLVDACPILKKLPLNSSSAHANKRRIVIQGREDWWRMLEWEDPATQKTFLPSFKPCIY